MICIDILLVIIFILLFSPFMTGLALHELLGIIFFLLVIPHLFFSWSWIRQSAKRFLTRTGWRNRFNYFLNIVLFVLIIAEVVSGLVISQVVLPFFSVNTINDRAWRALHNGASTATVITVSLHIAVNWKRIVGYFRKRIIVSGAMNKKYSPANLSFKQSLLKVFSVISTAVIIAAALYLLIGAPAEARMNITNEIARFRPKLIPGIVQFTGTAITMAIIAYIARCWLKLRL
jgi:Domain of unknown function (DUF4405)